MGARLVILVWMSAPQTEVDRNDSKKRKKRKQDSSPAARPVLADEATRFMQMEREVEGEFRPQMREALQSKVDREADALSSQVPTCSGCNNSMSYDDSRPVS